MLASVILVGSSFFFIIIYLLYYFIHTFLYKYLLCVCHVPGIILHAGDITVMQTDKVPALREP